MEMTPSDPLQPVSPASTPPPPALAFPDLCDDVLLVICSHLASLCSPPETPLKHLSLTNRRLHALLAPLLFKTLHINVPIKLLHVDTLRHFHARSLRIDMFGSMWWWSSGAYVASGDALDLFQLIHGLKALRTLEVSMLARSVDIFQAAFTSVEKDSRLFTLPDIETLVVSSSAAFLGAHCPSLKQLVIHDAGECVVETYTDLRTQLTPLDPHRRIAVNPHLQHLDVLALWSADEVTYVASEFPYLQSLNMRAIGHRYMTSLTRIIYILSQTMLRLKTLNLLTVHALDVGFRPIRRITILATTVDAIRSDMWRENEDRRVNTENNIARQTFAKIKALRELWLGEQRVARRAMGEVENGAKDGAKTAWVWERETDERDDSLAAMRWADMYCAERDAVVVRREWGT